MTRTALWTGLAALLILTGSILAEAQRGSGMGGGRGGMRGGIDRGGRRMPREIQDKMEALRALPVDQIWSAMSFGIDLPDSQLVVLKPLFTDSWAKRQQILAAAADSNDWDEAKDELKRLKKELDRKLKTVLTKDQRKSLEKLIKKQNNVSKMRFR